MALLGTIRGVPVLMYHDVLDAQAAAAVAGTPALKYAVTRERFAAHLDWLRRSGHSVVGLKELFSAPMGRERPVALTFDDGRMNNYTQAFPGLCQRGMTADFFLISNSVGTSGYMGWREVREMQRAGIGFHSHTADHLDLRRLDDSELRHQLVSSKQALEDGLGCSVDVLGIPYGLHNARVLRAAYAAGYKAVCNSRVWPAKPGASEISRVCVHWDTDDRSFARIVECDRAIYLAASLASAVRLPLKWLALQIVPERMGVNRQRKEVRAQG